MFSREKNWERDRESEKSLRTGDNPAEIWTGYTCHFIHLPLHESTNLGRNHSRFRHSESFSTVTWVSFTSSLCCLLLSLHTGDYWVQEPVTHSTSRQEAESVVSVRWQTTDGILMYFKWAKNITALCLQRVFAIAGSDKRTDAPNIKSNWSYNIQTRFILTACRKVIVDD